MIKKSNEEKKEDVWLSPMTQKPLHQQKIKDGQLE